MYAHSKNRHILEYLLESESMLYFFLIIYVFIFIIQYLNYFFINKLFCFSFLNAIYYLFNKDKSVFNE